MDLLQQVLFLILLIPAIWFFTKNVKKIRRNILLGHDNQSVDGNPSVRWKLVILNALGQRKMFSKPIPAFLHFWVYVGFVIINVEVLEIMIDGLTGHHRIFAPFLGQFYTFAISFFECLAVLVLISVIFLYIRRNVLKIPRFQSSDLNGFPRKDANIILYAEIVLMAALLIMNGADRALQLHANPHYHNVGGFLISGLFAPEMFYAHESTLIAIERGAWWFHLIGILVYLNYLPFSKHLHIILSFPNTFYSKLTNQGKMENMPVIQNEVNIMMGMAEPNPNDVPPTHFGAKDVQDLPWQSILSAYSCTECGRCTSACPANLTGKKLSPRKIMMDTRDRAEELGKYLDTKPENPLDGKSLYGDYISKEEILACTSCQACVEACPININPLDIIFQIKRHIIMDESAAPGLWNNMFTNIENNQTPWQFNPADRFNWAEEITIKN